MRLGPLVILVLLSALPTGAAYDFSPTAQARDELIGTHRLMVRPSMLADNIEYLAGRDVTVFNARVVGVFEPHAFLIESATREPEAVGRRDRVLVLLHHVALRVPADVLVASTVRVTGVARSLLGMQVSAEAPWPASLDRDRVDRLDVRASVLASSVQTPEGIELTERR